MGWIRIAFILTSCLGAQTTHVMPPSHSQREGTGFSNVPFGRSVPARIQAAYENRIARAGVVQGLHYRLDGGTTAVAKRLELEVRMAHLAFGVTAVQAEFARNLNAAAVTTLDRRLLDLPAQTVGTTPSPFAVGVPFDRPFSYDPGLGALVVDTTVHGQPPTAYVLDATWVCDSPLSNFGAPGCGRPSGPILVADSLTSQVLWGHPFTLRVHRAQPLAPTFLLLGTLESGPWNGTVLPVGLDFMGATGCSLSTDPLGVLQASADAAGVATYGFLLPSYTWLQGQWIRFQGVAVDAQANALGLVTSRGAKLEICGYEAVARVYATGTNPTTGLRELGVAPVLQLNMQ